MHLACSLSSHCWAWLCCSCVECIANQWYMYLVHYYKLCWPRPRFIITCMGVATTLLWVIILFLCIDSEWAPPHTQPYPYPYPAAYWAMSPGRVWNRLKGDCSCDTRAVHVWYTLLRLVVYNTLSRYSETAKDERTTLSNKWWWLAAFLSATAFNLYACCLQKTWLYSRLCMAECVNELVCNWVPETLQVKVCSMRYGCRRILE